MKTLHAPPPPSPPSRISPKRLLSSLRRYIVPALLIASLSCSNSSSSNNHPTTHQVPVIPRPNYTHISEKEKSPYTTWRTHPEAPIEWRIETLPAYGSWKQRVNIRNTSSGKLEITGLCTRYPNNRYLDDRQPGTFKLGFNHPLYPGQIQYLGIIPDGIPRSRDIIEGTQGENPTDPVYLFIADFRIR